MKRAHAMPFGAALLAGGGTRFALWAPGVSELVLELGEPTPRRLAMRADAGGWHRLDVPDAGAGTRYRFCLPDGLRVPDPASRSNPDDVHGASSVIDPHAFEWHDGEWRGRPWHEAVVYELHVGTFTAEGTFAAAQARLPALAELGITAIELMPLADFPGRWNWGYDGVLPFAPDASYGTPDELKALVDAAHGLGLMVLLDAVYNHFGPEGNYLHAYCPPFFNPAQRTPWGAAINFDGAMSRTVRDFFIHNALYWLEEFHMDGLRLDAVHAIHDASTPDIVTEIARALRDGPGRSRHVHLVLENDANDAARLAQSDEQTNAPRPQPASAQWNDDLHHAAHVLVTGEADGYYADFAPAPLAEFARALAEGFAFQGEPSAFRGGEMRGTPSGHLPLTSFVSFLQTHDQVGNRALGERIHQLADPVLLPAAWACLLLSPHVPMFFMGDEFAASAPFLYFCDFEPELAAAVSAGRRKEFGSFAAFESGDLVLPEPGDPATFAASKLAWDERAHGEHAQTLRHIEMLLALRRRRLTPRLAGQHGGGRFRLHDTALRVSWPIAGGHWHLLANFGPGEVAGLAPPRGRPVHHGGVIVEAGKTLRLQHGGVLVMLEDDEVARG